MSPITNRLYTDLDDRDDHPRAVWDADRPAIGKKDRYPAGANAGGSDGPCMVIVAPHPVVDLDASTGQGDLLATGGLQRDAPATLAYACPTESSIRIGNQALTRVPAASERSLVHQPPSSAARSVMEARPTPEELV